ncbi:MAG: Stp1/IreP family PP2C-type Ser/Thr phosphatase [Erysipelotrichaceae bacterium]|nr:Stp1/IreP family PP2C-type Ser/Thr phosphatase [Erysipelotrichaceae bacterium]
MKTYGSTDKGLVRKTNQDSYVIAANESGDLFCVVCDGIGGSKGGDVASSCAVRYFSTAFSENRGFLNEADLLSWLKVHIRKANDEIFTLSTTKREYQGMGTTMVALMLTSIGNYVINIGDSRCYALFENGRFVQLSEDHTLVQEMLKKKEITEEEAKNHVRRHYITNALGVWNEARYDVLHVTDAVDYFLLCSDGLHGYVEDNVIEKVLKDSRLDAKKKQHRLMELSLLAGGLDNITILLIKMEENEA